nr:aminotransferase class I/II-fold pyridoxal phosphate-dependent enzyme [Veronia nyctiphanis]
MVRLVSKTNVFLAELIADAVGLAVNDIQPDTPFQSLGVDSFIALQLISSLEKDFGQMPPTLLFENHCIADLAQYLSSEHTESLSKKLGYQTPSPLPSVSHGPASANVNPASDASTPVSSAPESATNAIKKASDFSSTSPVLGQPISLLPTLLLESNLKHTDEHIQLAIQEITRTYGAESSAVGRGNFAPSIFIGSAREGLFYCNRKKDLLITFGYLGPEKALAPLLGELETFCMSEGLELYLIEDGRLLGLRDALYSATPFAVLQRISELQSFTASGKAMRRLRYQASRFAKEGQAVTREYRVGTEAETDDSILALIDNWCAQKVMVNPYIDRLKREIRDNQLPAGQRFFLTYLGDKLQNAILVSGMPSHNGYLMDCEFYRGDMPIGGLEFAIVDIIDTLKNEGLDMFSLGVTWGAQMEDAGRSDPVARKVLEDLAAREVFDGSGNLQFKNKFRPDNTQIYLFKPLAAKRDRVLEIILTIANSKEPDGQAVATQKEETNANIIQQVATQEAEPAESIRPMLQQHGTTTSRHMLLEESGFNPANIEAHLVEHDLATDSWAKLDRPWLKAVSDADVPMPLDMLLRGIFPFSYLVTVNSGDQAEYCLWQSLETGSKRVLQNLMFPTFIYNQMRAGFQPEEVAQHQNGYAGSLMDLDLLQNRLNDDQNPVAAVCVELLSNGAGGLAVPVSHLVRVKALLATQHIPLIVDATRILDNAIAALPGDNDDRVWGEVREACGLADVVTASLSKNFGIRQGGLIAMNDQSLYQSVRQQASKAQFLLNGVGEQALVAALREPVNLLSSIRRRQQHTTQLAESFRAAGWPVYKPMAAMPYCWMPHV